MNEEEAKWQKHSSELQLELEQWQKDRKSLPAVPLPTKNVPRNDNDGKTFCPHCQKRVDPLARNTESIRAGVYIDLPGPLGVIAPITKIQTNYYCPKCDNQVVPQHQWERMKRESENEEIGFIFAGTFLCFFIAIIVAIGIDFHIKETKRAAEALKWAEDKKAWDKPPDVVPYRSE